MNKEYFNQLIDDALLTECLEDTLILEQVKDRSGVCIIPEKQDEAARNIIEFMGRKLEEITGSKYKNLEYKFSPPLIEEEWEEFFS